MKHVRTGSGENMTHKELKQLNDAINITPTEIGKLREDCGLTIREFSDIFLVEDQIILSWESGESIPNPFYITVLMQLRKKVDKIGTKEESARLIKQKFNIGVIFSFLTWLYNENPDKNTNNSTCIGNSILPV